VIVPKLDGILETAIHTEDMVRSRAFYEGVLGLAPMYADDRLSAYAVAGRDVLLVFRKGATGQTVTLPSGTIPGHDGDGALHVAFAISKDELDGWEAHLALPGVTIVAAPFASKFDIRRTQAGAVILLRSFSVPLEQHCRSLASASVKITCG